MADKILGRDHTDDTNPTASYFVTGDNGTSNVDIKLGNLFKQLYDTSKDHVYIIAVSELTADRTITLPLLTGNDVFVFADFVQTLNYKRIPPRVTEETSSATPTINTDNCDIFQVTALALAITSFTTNLSGTPTDGQKLMIEVLDNGTARAIAWGASFANGPGTLPTTTTLSKWLYVGFEWSASRSKWICLATGSEQ